MDHKMIREIKERIADIERMRTGLTEEEQEIVAHYLKANEVWFWMAIADVIEFDREKRDNPPA